MSTTLHFQDIKKQQNVICLVKTRMGVLFQITTFVRFNYFKSDCFVLCATIIVLSIPKKYLNRLLTNGSVISEPLLKKY